MNDRSRHLPFAIHYTPERPCMCMMVEELRDYTAACSPCSATPQRLSILQTHAPRRRVYSVLRSSAQVDNSIPAASSRKEPVNRPVS